MADQSGTTVPDAHLDDDKHPQEGQFVGATLQIDNASNQNGEEPGVTFVGQGPTFNRDRPGSMFGRQSVKSTSSRTSLKPGVVKNDAVSHTYFSYKEDSFSKAVRVCEQRLKTELDGKIVGAWLLTEIDHWDNEREKIVVLAENSLCLFRYHFILHKVEEFKRVLLHMIDTIAVGDFVYPEKSLMPLRKHGGVQIRWNRGEEPSFAQKWNPWSSSIPFLTLSHHPLIYNPKENETVTYSADDFYESLVKGVSDALKKKNPELKLTIVEGPILIESYASLSSMIFNQSGLGFFMDRNGICF